MTLIFSHINDVTGLLCIGDIIGSRAGSRESNIVLPLRDATFRSETEERSVTTLLQKTTIRNRTLFQWSGNSLNASIILKKLLTQSTDGRDHADFKKIVESGDVPPSQLADLSLIYHYLHNDGKVSRICWNCTENSPDQLDYRYAGSGLGNFFYNFQLDYEDDHPDYVAVRHDLMARIVTNTILERYSNTTLDSFYGGWLELTYRTASSFAKLPYGIKFWSFKDDVLGSGGPTYLGWYHGATLLITRHQFHETTAGVQAKLANTIVPDFLVGKPQGDFLDFQAQNAEMIFHIVIDEEGKRFFCHLDTTPSPASFLVSTSPAGLRIQEGSNFRAEMLQRLGSKPRNWMEVTWN